VARDKFQAHMDNTDLWEAVWRFDVVELERLLKEGADVDGRWEDADAMTTYTPIHVAILTNDTDMVKVLVSYGAAMPNFPNGTTVRRAALFSNNLEILRCIMEHGGKKDIDTRDNKGLTLMEYAVTKTRADIMSLLIEYGANVNAVNEDGMSILHFAVASNKPVMVGILASNGANMSAVARRGMTALHLAAYAGFADVARELVKNNANITDVFGFNNLTAEQIAHSNNFPEVAMLLHEESVTRSKCVAFAMGHHNRVGAGSMVARMDPELLRIILTAV
jgi:ankyrin repeat protein